MSEHVGIFTRVSWGNEQLNTVSLHLSAGIQLDGTLWGRGDDVTGLAFSHAGLSDEVEGDDEVLVEGYYAATLSPHPGLSGHLQAVSNRAGDSDNDDVIVASLRASAAF
ncbi:MAG: carbohydrate porin [Planctomycetota bacterium]